MLKKLLLDAPALHRSAARALALGPTRLPRRALSQYSKQFYKVNKDDADSRRGGASQPSHMGYPSHPPSPTPSFNASTEIIGEVIDNAVNLMDARPGDSVDVPYEITVSAR